MNLIRKRKGTESALDPMHPDFSLTMAGPSKTARRGSQWPLHPEPPGQTDTGAAIEPFLPNLAMAARRNKPLTGRHRSGKDFNFIVAQRNQP